MTDVVSTAPYCSEDIRKLLRAYNLLVVTRDHERTIVGQVSREWLQSESEDWLRLSSLSAGTLRSVRGREVMVDALMPDLDADPDAVDVDLLLAQVASSDKFVNSNSLPKLEPAIAAEVLLGNLLLGVQKYGNRRRGSPSLTNDLIIAAMVRDAVGRPDRYSAGLPGDCENINMDRIEELFGPAVVQHLYQLRGFIDQFEVSLASGNCAKLKLPRPFASVVMAIEAASLRLIARAAGDEILANLDSARKAEVSALGINCDCEFPELPLLRAQYERTRHAMQLPGVDYGALAEPIGQTLMLAVQDVLEDPGKRRRLVGRRGKAVRDVHMNLPLIESYNASENLNSLATIHIAALEMMQFLEKGRRKSSSTMLGHSLRLAATAERLLGAELEPCIATAAILHDVVEDGSRLVAGYDQSLSNIKLRFGGPLAAMVSELTDADTASAGVQKAHATLQQHNLALPEEQYNVDRFTEMPLEPTATHEPYTLGGVVIKLIDTAMSEEEGIRDPDVMSAWWKHSGIRIFWSHNVRGRIVRPLLLKLSHEISHYEVSPGDYKNKRWNAELIEGLRRVLMFSIVSADQYAVQNLAILADEHQLTVLERDCLIRQFFDPECDADSFASDVVESLLTEERLNSSIAAGNVPESGYVTLYARNGKHDAIRDCSTFMQYRAAAQQRGDIASRLDLRRSRPEDFVKTVHEVVWLYDYRKVA